MAFSGWNINVNSTAKLHLWHSKLQNIIILKAIQQRASCQLNKNVILNIV